MFDLYNDYYNQLQDTGCTIGFGLDGQSKCSLGNDQATQYCNSNPQALCCTSTTNIIPVSSTNSTVPPSASATPSVDDNAVAGGSKSSVVNPLFIGLAALGVVLIVLIASAVYFFKRPKNKGNNRKIGSNTKHESFASSAVGGNQMEAIFDYQANLFDELTLSTIFVNI